MILDTPVCRLRQVVAAIHRRQRSELRGRGALVEWHAKILATVISATVPMEKGKQNPLMEWVKTISLYPEGSDLADPATTGRRTVGSEHPPEADPEAIAKYGFDPEHPPVRDAPRGSFEGAMQLTQER